ncbi:MAG: S41 family peptidase, partial [Akkermansiaceae bacterium]
QPQKLKLFHKEDLEETLNPQLAIKSTSDASFSPSGLEIVFTAENDLWAMDTILRKPRRLTNTPGHEKDVWFSHDGKTILYLYDDGVNTEIRRLAKPDATGFWWEAENCTHTVVVKSSERPDGILPGPKGKKIAYTTYPGSLWVSNPDGTEPTRLVESWNAPRAEWSPDGKWLTYSMQDDDFNSDIYIIPADGSSAPVNISRHPDSDLSPAWSPDGRRLAFIGRHHKESYDIFFVDLYAKDEVKDKDGETRERAKKAMKGDPNYRGSAKKTVKKVVKKITGENKKKEPETFNLTNIQQRVQRIQVKGGPAYQLMWYSDSKRLLFQSRGGKTTYSIEAKPGAAPKKFADASGSVIRMTSKGKIFWLSGGVPAVLSGGRNTKYPFSIYTQRDHKEWKRMMFRTAWNTMRDSFYDPAMNNRNWQSVLEKYEEAATYAPNSATFDRIANMMLGELNASHMGCRSKTWPASWKKQVRWTESTVHLGLRFDPSHQGKGWKVSQVIPRSPADREISRVEAGETILTVNGTEVSSSTPLASVLTLRTGELVHLTVSNKDGEERKVKIQPISYSAARSLASKAGINATAKATDELSGGKLGYIHIARMMWDEFEKFEHHLYEQGAGKEGLVIDVRDNGGGFTTDHLLTALCQPRHAYTIPRNGGIGYPQDRIVYATWNKPIIVLCNQNSFSNAEIFAHAIRTLGRGKVVGVTTAGGVISTGSTTIMGTASLRLPFRGWFNSETGEDMELDGAKPHITIWNQPGELSRGKDVQLEKAVKLLIADTTRAKQAPKPKYQSKR